MKKSYSNVNAWITCTKYIFNMYTFIINLFMSNYYTNIHFYNFFDYALEYITIAQTLLSEIGRKHHNNVHVYTNNYPKR